MYEFKIREPRSVRPDLGVEIEQLAFVAVFFVLRSALRTLEVPAPRWMLPVPGYAVGVAGAYWTMA